MSKKSFIVFLLILFSFSVPTFAQDPALCSDTEGSIYYGNGIRADFDSAAGGLILLMDALSSSLSNEELTKIEFALAYNPSDGAILDIFESAVQDLSTDASEFWRSWFGLIPMPDTLRDMITDAIANFYNSPSLVITDSLLNHVAIYKRSILEGKKVLLVAHSQGTFYANQAYINLNNTERDSFGIVSVALMDDHVEGNDPYVTLVTDIAVDAVRIAKSLAGLNGPLPSNVANASRSDWLGHSFEREYLMNLSASRSIIVSTSLNVFNSLVQPDQIARSGIITVTLTWGAEPDVDLHVFEPDNTHVFYANLLGTSGYLDVDDVTSWGPEHYYVSCDSLQNGIYKVGVNYYHGYGPEVAKINVRAGLIERNFYRFLSTPYYSSGNNYPIPVANIIVTGNPLTGFHFEVQ